MYDTLAARTSRWADAVHSGRFATSTLAPGGESVCDLRLLLMSLHGFCRTSPCRPRAHRFLVSSPSCLSRSLFLAWSSFGSNHLSFQLGFNPNIFPRHDILKCPSNSPQADRVRTYIIRWPGTGSKQPAAASAAMLQPSTATLSDVSIGADANALLSVLVHT